MILMIFVYVFFDTENQDSFAIYQADLTGDWLPIKRLRVQLLAIVKMYFLSLCMLSASFRTNGNEN